MKCVPGGGREGVKNPENFAYVLNGSPLRGKESEVNLEMHQVQPYLSLPFRFKYPPHRRAWSGGCLTSTLDPKSKSKGATRAEREDKEDLPSSKEASREPED